MGYLEDKVVANKLQQIQAEKAKQYDAMQEKAVQQHLAEQMYNAHKQGEERGARYATQDILNGLAGAYGRTPMEQFYNQPRFTPGQSAPVDSLGSILPDNRR